jgi:hypothetical protein
VQGSCGVFGQSSSFNVVFPAGNLFSTSCNLGNPHFGFAGSFGHVTYSHHNAARCEPDDACINNVSKITKDECTDLTSTTGACPSKYVPFTISSIRDRVADIRIVIRNITVVFDDNQYPTGLANYVNDPMVSASALYDSLMNISWLSDKILISTLDRSPQLSAVQAAMLLLKNAPHTPQMQQIITLLNVQDTMDSLATAGVVTDTATGRLVRINLLHTLENEKNTTYFDWLYALQLDSIIDFTEIIDTMKLETEYPYLVQLSELYTLKGQYADADSLLSNIMANYISYGITDFAPLYSVYFNYIDNLLQWWGRSYHSLATNNELTPSNAEILEIIEQFAALEEYEYPAAARAQNILGLLYGNWHNIELKHLEEESFYRRRNTVEETKEEIISLEAKHDYRLKPNLFDGKLFANITLQAEEQGKLEIYNLQGVLVGNLQLINGKNELDLTPMNLPNGVYLYRVWANDEIKHSDNLSSG